MRLTLFVLVSMMILLVGSLFAQTDTNTASQPTPTATFSPRGMEGIFQTLRVNYGLELENTSESFPAHDDISEFIRWFGFQYLDTYPYMPYATQINIGFMGYDQYQRLIPTVSESAAISISEYLQEMYSEHPVMAWIGLHKEGFALIYTRRCNGPRCNTVSEQKTMFTREAVGIFVTYVRDAALNQDESLELIRKTYPRLAASGIEVTPLREGFVLRRDGVHNARGDEITLMYYAGTKPLEHTTAVYAVIAVGEEFTELAIPQP